MPDNDFIVEANKVPGLRVGHLVSGVYKADYGGRSAFATNPRDAVVLVLNRATERGRR